jgi:hypothetical protein
LTRQRKIAFAEAPKNGFMLLYDGVTLKFKKKNGMPPVSQHGLFVQSTDPS